MKTNVITFVVLLLSKFSSIRASQVCCPGLECFNDDPPYSSLPLPQCPEDMGLSFKLYTRENPSEGEEFSRTIIPPSFKEDVMLVFVVHGHTIGEKVQWIYEMKDATLKKGDYNVVVVDWAGGSQLINYLQSASNTRTVGAEIALLAKHAVEQRGSSRERLQCVGHCLGAQACGQAGHGFKFGRITGLDASSILFEDYGRGLNSSCADYVDVIHTSGQSYAGLVRVGVMKTIGHADFYPNGGQSQPGCELGLGGLWSLGNAISKSSSIYDMLQKVLSSRGPLCSHMRATDFYIESILTPCFVTSLSCHDQFDLPGSCSKGKETQTMGFDSYMHPSRGIFYLTTNAKTPFCQS